MQKFEHFADNLGKLYNLRAKFQIELAHTEQDIESRQLYMAPAGGWPGSNDVTRKAARDKAFAEDDVLKKLSGQALDLRNELTLTDKDIAIWEVRFKAARWETREHLIEALRMVHGIAPEENNQASEGGFDDAADNASEAAADAVLEKMLNNPPDDEPEPSEEVITFPHRDDFPF